MADSSAELLFRISADSTPAQADLAALRGAVATTCGEAAAGGAAAESSLGQSLGGVHEGFARVGSTTRETREALRGLGEEIGIGMPRFVSSWLASLGGVSTVMAAAFAPIAVIGLIEVLGRIPGALQKGIDWLHGWTAEAKKAFEQTAKDELEWETRTIRMDERLRAIALIGVEGMKKWNLEAVINSQNYDQVKNKLTELNQALIENAAIAATAQGAKAMIGEKDLSKLQYGPTSQQIEKAKMNMKELGPIIKELAAQLDDLSIKSKEIPAQTAAAAATAAADRQAAIEKEIQDWTNAERRRIAAQHEAEEKGDAEDAKRREEQEKEREEAAAKEARRLAEQGKREREGEAALREQLAREDATTLEGKEAAVNAEIALERDKYAEEGKLSTTAEALLEQLRQARLAKLRAESGAAYAQQMAALGEHLQQIERAEDTSRQRIEGQYAADVAKFSAAEEKKELTAARSEEQRTEIATRYAAIRAALLGKEQTELQALANSQGFHAVFGAGFAEMIRGNEDLSKEWAHSTDQAAMLVRVSLEGLKETAEETFKSFAAGMGASIESAVIHSKSIKEAMKAETESVLEALAAQATVHAISSLALGFEDEAKYDYMGASAAFTAAAIWGSVAAAATVGGRLAAGSGGGATGAGAGAAGSGGGAARGGDTGQGTGRTAAGQGGPHVTVNVWGHVYGTGGIAEVAAAINDAVLNQDVVLTATNTKTGVQVTR